jgi:hypothetical protein
MNKTLIVALYKKNNLECNSYVGIFLNDLFSPPLESISLKPNRNDMLAEYDIADKLHSLVQDSRHKIMISFSEEFSILVDKDSNRKIFFIKSDGFFDINALIKKLKF